MRDAGSASAFSSSLHWRRLPTDTSACLASVNERCSSSSCSGRLLARKSDTTAGARRGASSRFLALAEACTASDAPPRNESTVILTLLEPLEKRQATCVSWSTTRACDASELQQAQPL
eukprot:6183951-Pleurochrysis_carterae.AAC.4